VVQNVKYTVSLRARNAAGISASSNPVAFTSPSPCTGTPGVPENFLFYKVGGVVTAVWDPASSGGAPTGYVVNVTGAVNVSIPTSLRGISRAVPPGTYSMTIVATNACGTSAPTAAQSLTVP
jgi:hypothetical protein